MLKLIKKIKSIFNPEINLEKYQELINSGKYRKLTQKEIYNSRNELEKYLAILSYKERTLKRKQKYSFGAQQLDEEIYKIEKTYDKISKIIDTLMRTNPQPAK